MKFTLSWLKDHLDTTATLDEIAVALTALGLEVEGVEDPAEKLGAFTIAHVVSADPHPDADRLKLCMVDTGAETLQVVCGAPNAKAGMKGVFAPVGTYIPGSDITLKKGVIRGQESNGMLCSMRELELSDEHEGIIELPGDAPVGTGFAAWAGHDDPVIEIALTPDRADCAGVRGIARDLAAAGIGRLKPMTVKTVPGRFPSPIGVTIAGDAKTACPLFIGRYVRGVKNSPSPEWLQKKLSAIGLRPISALVDITNLTSIDLARPLHVFDADTLSGNITVRMTRAGEQLAALNDKTYTLDDGAVAIADDDGVLGLGGIIGGEASGCTEETTNVYIECALFDPGVIAAAGRRLGIESDARYRFERHVDPGFALAAMEHATQLVMDLCGGEPSEIVVAGAVPDEQRVITLHPSQVEHLGGMAVPMDEQVRILFALGCDVRDGDQGALTVTVPTWRADIHGAADLVEEILRVMGYDAIPVTPLARATTLPPAAWPDHLERRNTARRALAARGLSEAVTWSFMAAEHAALFGQNDPSLTLKNPISVELGVMRPTILANLAMAAGRNETRGHGDVGLFEIGPVFRGTAADQQPAAIAGLRAGLASPRHWAGAARNVDVFDVRADAMAALEAAGAPVAGIQITADAPDWFHPGRSGVLRMGPNVLAHFGELHPAVLEALDAKGPMAGFEIFTDRIPAPKKKGAARALAQLSAFQPVARDFAFVMDRDVAAGDVLKAALGADRKLVVDATVFDIYEGKGVPEGQKSLAITVTLQPTDKTLTDAEIEAVAGQIVANVGKHTGASLRG